MIKYARTSKNDYTCTHNAVNEMGPFHINTGIKNRPQTLNSLIMFVHI